MKKKRKISKLEVFANNFNRQNQATFKSEPEPKLETVKTGHASFLEIAIIGIIVVMVILAGLRVAWYYRTPQGVTESIVQPSIAPTPIPVVQSRKAHHFKKRKHVRAKVLSGQNQLVKFPDFVRISATSKTWGISLTRTAIYKDSSIKHSNKKSKALSPAKDWPDEDYEEGYLRGLKDCNDKDYWDAYVQGLKDCKEKKP